RIASSVAECRARVNGGVCTRLHPLEPPRGVAPRPPWRACSPPRSTTILQTSRIRVTPQEVRTMIKVEKLTDEKGQVWIQDPPVARFLFQSTGVMAWIWLAVRLFVGYDFLVAGAHKFQTAAWMDGSGAGISGFWKGALGTTPAGAPVITFDWYRTF